jgi:hypothetical protein
MFRFTIRDVLWLMVVVGLSVGWYSHHLSWQRYYDDVMRLVIREADDSNRQIIALSRENTTLKRSNSASHPTSTAPLSPK